LHLQYSCILTIGYIGTHELDVDGSGGGNRMKISVLVHMWICIYRKLICMYRNR
jgi:hypothetical protein